MQILLVRSQLQKLLRADKILKNYPYSAFRTQNLASVSIDDVRVILKNSKESIFRMSTDRVFGGALFLKTLESCLNQHLVKIDF